MGPYDDDTLKRKEWLSLVNAYLEGGGNGIVAVNTFMVPKEKVPTKNWGYPSAGRSGAFLQEYRQRAIRDARKAFPNITIIATGGIDSVEEAWDAFRAGANAIECYTSYTFHGFGLLIKIAHGIREKLYTLGYMNLKEFQKTKYNI